MKGLNEGPHTAKTSAIFPGRLLTVWKDGRRRMAVVATVALLLAACESDTLKSEVSSLKSFLHDGSTRRDEVILRLGIPHATFEKDRIIGYYLSSRDELILIFDDQGRLMQHRFLKFPSEQP